MNFDILEMERRLAQDLSGTIALCEENYHRQVDEIAQAVLSHREKSPVVLLAGPSGSSKTTTGTRLKEKIQALGVPAHLISMDNYYLDWDDPDFPVLANGEHDLESPLGLDIPLLNEHFALLETGEDIFVPIYNFPTRSRLPDKHLHMDAAHGDVFIFEGIHALNPRFTSQHPDAFRLYISPVASFEAEGDLLCTPQLLRLLRRVTRDYQFRASSAEFSLKLWGNVISAEKIYISPYKAQAHGTIDTTLGYELGALKPYALPLFRELPQDVPCRDQVDAALRALELVTEIPKELVPQDSIIREFIG